VDWRGWFLPRFGGRRPQPESLSPPQAEDLEQLAELEVRGSRLALPHPVRAMVVFEEEAPARSAREQLEHEGFRCQLRSSPGAGWLVTAIVELVPTPGAITRLREQMEELARELGGRYQGWEAPVVR
jgi:Regulator of ribonuclease activity B